MAGGKSPPATLHQLASAGVSLVNYSTPCLFAAHDAVNAAMSALKQDDGRLAAARPGNVNVKSCTRLLNGNSEGLMSNGQSAGFRDESDLTTLSTKNRPQSEPG
jgi:hypothetical protein